MKPMETDLGSGPGEPVVAPRESAAFEEFLSRRPAPDDSTLADRIEADGRARLAAGEPVGLDRYLRAVPDLPARRNPLDAAIAAALRSLSGSEEATPGAVEALVGAHPELAPAIHAAAFFSRCVASTRSLLRAGRAAGALTLPADFGPALPDGRTRYQCVELLGEGASACVYRAIDRHLSDESAPASVAIKALALAPTSPLELQRLTEEAVRARRIRHPNVVQVIDRGASPDGRPYIIYEMVEGGSRTAVVRQRGLPLPAREAARLVAGAARGVQAIHGAGLVHRDIKPSNILLSKEGDPKVADLGVAAALASRAEESWAEGDAGPVGNLAYMAPEQYRMDEGAMGPSADVYSLGGVLFWLLTGRLPNGDTPEAVALAHATPGLRAIAPSARERNPRVDRDLDAICRRALAPSPEDRYEAAGLLARDLDSWLAAEPIYWTRPSAPKVVRLWARRHQRAAFSLAGGVVMGFATAWTIIAFDIDRREQRRRADVQAVSLAEEERRKLSVMSAILEFRDRWTDVRNTGLVTQNLSAIWMLEWLTGPGMLTDQPDPGLIWSMRVTVIEKVIALIVADGGDGSLDAMIWRTGLALWLMHLDRDAEADALLARCEEEWAARLGPDDPWTFRFRAMRGAAAIPALVAGLGTAPAATGSAESAARESLAATVMTLEGLLERLRTVPGDTPLVDIVEARVGAAREALSAPAQASVAREQ